jgi:predicted esterase
MTTQRLRRAAIAVLAISFPAVLGVPEPLATRAHAAPGDVGGAAGAAARSLDVETLVAAAPAEHREAVRFLAEHMPARDRESLDPSFVLGHVAERIEARDRAPWGASLPEHLFLNDVVPYAIASETRERLDPAFIERCRRITADATTPGEAALALNATLFGELGVKYGTSRRRPDQSVSETCEQGVATCTGLSVLLVQACRAVAVPARIAGVASWSDDRGNHTWVEVWDGEAWRFVGAAEPDGRGFDHAWFTGDASRAVPGHPRYAVVASSWAPTDRHFPMVWAPRDRSVPGIDVTRRYLRGEAAGDPDSVRLMVRMLGPDGRRVVGDVRITGADIDRTVTTLGPEADMNRHAELAVAPGTRLWIVGTTAAGASTDPVEVDLGTASAGETRLVTLRTAGESLSDADRAAARAWFDAFFAAPADERAALAAAEHPLDARLRTPEGDAALREIAFAAWQAAPIHAETAADIAADRVRAGGYESPYTVKQVGERPANGWGLVIAMHGGGGVPKRVNDSQWDVMKRYYRDQPDAGGYLYVALRAPTDEWNGFYTGYIYPLIEQLIAQFVVHRDVDPQRVHAIGYSHGGYGAYAIGPNLPHRFAAVHASAAAATGGETVAESLMNLRFTAMIGELDTAYGRIERNREFRVRLAELKAATDPDLYPGGVTEIAGNGHGGLPDRDWLAEMLPHERNTSPARLWWKQTGGQVTGHYWLADPSPTRGGDVQASRAGNTITLETQDVDSLELRLDARIIDPNAPVRIRTGENERTVEVSPRIGTLAATLLEVRDPQLAATIVVPVAAPE